MVRWLICYGAYSYECFGGHFTQLSVLSTIAMCDVLELIKMNEVISYVFLYLRFCSFGSACVCLFYRSLVSSHKNIYRETATQHTTSLQRQAG